LAQAYYQFWVRRDFDGARRSLELLQRRWPNNSDIAETLEQVAIHQGQWDKAPAYINRAIGLNPRNRGLREEAAWALYRATRDFSDALKGYDQALEIWPDDKNLIAGKASVFQSLGELDRADELLKQLRPAAKDGFVVGTICDQAKLRRRYSDGVALLRSFLDQADSLSAVERDSYPRRLADLQRLSGDLANANVTYAQVRKELERKLAEQPDDADSNSALATVCAGLGDKQLATRYIERAISLRPAAEDAFLGPAYEETRARIAARFEQKDVAIPILEHLLKTPYVESITPALLRLDPDFDLLRGEPRFEKLCEESPSQTSK
jgi:tetratricopeptide (TPR) repeat protein